MSELKNWCVESLLDIDLYKFTMNQLFLYKHPDLSGEYVFKCRNKGVVFTKEMFAEIERQVNHLCTLRFTDEELDYLKSIRFLKPNYIEFLRLWQPQQKYITMWLENGELNIRVRGPLFSAMQFEIYLLEIVNEVYFRKHPLYDYDTMVESAREKLNKNIEAFKNGTYTFKFAEFGCRRRLSQEWEEEVIQTYVDNGITNMVGTSNVYLAYKYNLRPIGSYAHEAVQCYQGMSNIPLAYGNYYMMEDWYDLYRGAAGLGTALTDTITTDLFLLDFDKSKASTFDGVRHDSGDPYIWGEKIILHYESLRIDPKSKTLLFSDSLNFEKAQKIYDHFKDRIGVSFGIGTYVSNNTMAEPLNIVIKLQYVNGRPVAKLSDDAGKAMCQDSSYVEYLKNAVKFRLENERK